MPSLIPVYEQRTRASGGAIQVPENPGAVAGGLREIGRALHEREDRIQRVREEDENAWAAENLATFQGKWEREIGARQESATASASGITETLLDDYDKDVRALTARAPSERIRRALKQRAEVEFREHLWTRMSGFEAARAADYNRGIVTNARDQKRKVVQSDPFMFDQMVGEMDEVVDGIRLQDAEKDKQRQLTREELANDAAIRIINSNPREAVAALRAKPGESGLSFIEALSPDDRLARTNQAENELKRRDAEFRAMRAEARDNLAGARADALAAKASGLHAELPSRAAYRAAYEDGDQRYRQDQQLMATYDTVSAAVILPREEGAALIGQYAPTQQEGAADQAEVLENAGRLYAKQRGLFEQDPALGVVQRDPDLRDGLQTIATGNASPEVVRAYVGKVRGAQQAAGILEPKLLPASYAAQLSASLAFNPERPGQRAQQLAVMRQQWGTAFPQVIRELSPTLEGDARVMVDMRPEVAKQYDQALATLTQVKARVPGPDVRLIQDKVRVNLGGLEETLLYADDGVARYAEIQAAAQLLAMTYYGNGTDATKAAELATNAVVNERYNYRDTLRIPTGEDADLMEASTTGIKFSLPDLQVTPMSGEKLAVAQSELKTYVEREGYWVTTSDEGGAELRVPYAGQSVPVMRADGTRMRFTWDELAASKARWAPEYIRKGLPK